MSDVMRELTAALREASSHWPTPLGEDECRDLARALTPLVANYRKRLGEAWGAWLDLTLDHRLEDGAPLLDTVFALRPDLRERLTELRTDANNRRSELLWAMADACPGPHAFQQHRDGKPPWCRACGRSADGTQVEEKS